MDAEDLRVRMKTHTAEFGLSKKLNTCGFEEQRIPKKERTESQSSQEWDRDDGRRCMQGARSGRWIFVGAISSRNSRSCQGAVSKWR